MAQVSRAPIASGPDRAHDYRVLGHGLYQFCFIEGLARSRAGTVALMLAASPAFIAIVGRIFRVERVGPRGWAGIALQLVGISFVVLRISRAFDE